MFTAYLYPQPVPRQLVLVAGITQELEDVTRSQAFLFFLLFLQGISEIVPISKRLEETEACVGAEPNDEGGEISLGVTLENKLLVVLKGKLR